MVVAAPSLRLIKGVVFMLIAVTIWSGWMILSRYSVRGTLSPWDISALRFGVSGVLMLPILIKKGMSVGPYGKKGGVLLALLMGAPYNIIAISGMHYAPASHAAGIINTVMLSTSTLGGIILLKEKTTAARLFGVCLSIGGIFCIIHASNISAESGVGISSALFILAGAMWGIYALLVRAWNADSLQATALVCSLSLLIYMPIYLLFIPSHIGLENIHEVIIQGFYQGIVTSILAFWCFNRSVGLLGITFSSAFMPLVLIFSTIMAIPFLDEMPGKLEWLGIALASVGVFLATGIIERLQARGTSRPRPIAE